MKFPKLRNKFVLAPMAGYTDLGCRLLCKKHGCALTYTEMVSAEAICAKSGLAKKLAKTSKAEKPVGVQIFGNSPKTMAKAAKILEKNFDVIDINFGCPSHKITKQGSGSALLSNPEKIYGIVKAVCSAVKKPVTAKIRISNDWKKTVEIAKLIEKAGASAITVHARTVSQGYSGKADLDAIKKIRKHIKIKLIGNGDVRTPEDAKKMFATKCDYAMIGRGALGNPFIFEQCNDFMKKGKYNQINDEDKIRCLLDYIKIAEKCKSPFLTIRNNAHCFTKGIPEGAKLRDRISRVKNLKELKKIFT